jgi:hypothetical protein
MAKNEMSQTEKKQKLKELASFLKKSWSLSNDLLGNESNYSKDDNSLQNVREGIEDAQRNLEYVLDRNKSKK